jgi:hypothetical protein
LMERIGRHAILLGGERMNNTNFKSSLGESPYWSQVVVASAFHNDDGVLDVLPS